MALTQGDRSAFATVFGLPTMRWIILSGIFHNFNMYALNSFNMPFLQRFHHMSLRDASAASSIAAGLVGAIGLPAGGWLADRLSVRRRNARLLLAAWCMTVAAPCLFLALNQPRDAIGSYIVLMAAGTTTMYVYYATVYAAIQDVIEPRLRGTAMTESFKATGLHDAMYAIPALALLAAAVLFAAARCAERDAMP